MNWRWRTLGTVGLLGVLGWRLAHLGEWNRVGEMLAGTDPVALLSWGLGAVAVYLVAQTVSALRWQLMAQPLGFEAPYRRFLSFYFIGMFFNLVLPTSVGGDVVRAWYLAGEREGKRSVAVLSVLADRLSGLGILVGLACVAALVCPVPLAPWLRWTVAGLGTLVVLSLAGFVLVLATGAEGQAARLPFVGERLQRLLGLSRVYAHHPRLLLSTMLLSVLVQGLNVVLGWLIGVALGLPVPFSYYAIVVPMVALLTLVPISLNGMGLRELGTVVLLAPLGVETHQAVALAFLQFLACSAVALMGCGFYLTNRSTRTEPAGDEQVLAFPQEEGRRSAA